MYSVEIDFTRVLNNLKVILKHCFTTIYLNGSGNVNSEAKVEKLCATTAKIISYVVLNCLVEYKNQRGEQVDANLRTLVKRIDYRSISIPKFAAVMIRRLNTVTLRGNLIYELRPISYNTQSVTDNWSENLLYTYKDRIVPLLTQVGINFLPVPRPRHFESEGSGFWFTRCSESNRYVTSYGLSSLEYDILDCAISGLGPWTRADLSKVTDQTVADSKAYITTSVVVNDQNRDEILLAFDRVCKIEFQLNVKLLRNAKIEKIIELLLEL